MEQLQSEIKQSKYGEENQQEAWYGSSVETKSDPIRDKQSGEPIILRFFQFQANPELLKLHKPTKQQLFNSHQKQIEMMLWGDGLQIVHEVEPKILISKKKDQYQIFITCKARRGVAVTDTPQALEKIWQKQ